MTGETLTDPDDDHARQLEQIRTTGIAREQDEAVIGEGAVASPVFDSWGGVVGAIGVVVSGATGHRPRRPGARDRPGALPRARRAVLAAPADLSRPVVPAASGAGNTRPGGAGRADPFRVFLRARGVRARAWP